MEKAKFQQYLKEFKKANSYSDIFFDLTHYSDKDLRDRHIEIMILGRSHGFTVDTVHLNGSLNDLLHSIIKKHRSRTNKFYVIIPIVTFGYHAPNHYITYSFCRIKNKIHSG